MLVTLFASSLITQDGYNVVQGGNKVGKGVRLDERNYVMAHCPFLRDNLNATRQELGRRSKYLQMMDDANHGGFQADIAEIKNDLAEISDGLCELDSLCDQVRAGIQAMESQTAKTEQQNKDLAEILAAMEHLEAMLAANK
ncbi:hypothetical protein F5Y01DRAFT_317148 [Xylaria sp. FL0043]|nr:hypothetical protein F5Y01DRAFT_317148 [Xylaria sp. FL0043]